MIVDHQLCLFNSRHLFHLFCFKCKDTSCGEIKTGGSKGIFSDVIRSKVKIIAKGEIIDDDGNELMMNFN